MSVCACAFKIQGEWERQTRASHALSSKDAAAGEMQEIITVLQLPPSESFSSRVSLESR